MTEVASRLPSRFDHGILRLAREIRAEVAEALASRGTAPAGGQQLDGSGTVATARRLVVRALDQRVAAILAGGGDPPSGTDERAVTDLVLAMLFGLGVLQLWVDDPAVENIDVNGAEVAYVTYADGTKELVGPVAESDEELIATI